MSRARKLVPFSDAWKTFVANAIAKPPAKRSQLELEAIKLAEESWTAEAAGPVMGRLWWRADDPEEFVTHVADVAKAGGRILSVDRSDPTCISYVFEIDMATADAKLGYHVEDDEWLTADHYVVECQDDDGKYVRATRRTFPDKASAKKFADPIARSRSPRIRPIYEG